MNVKTLDELKAENQLSDDSAEEQPLVEPEEVEPEEVEPEEVAPEEVEPEETESWLSTDDPETEERTVPLTDHISIRQKLKSRLRDQKTEIEQLREELRAVKQPQSADQPVKRPRRQDFRDLDDPDEAYEQAYERWLLQDVESRALKRVQREQQEQQELAQRRALERSVESHYDRAARLVAESKVSADQYQAADSAVLHTIQSVYGDQAELIRDSFIDRLGPGSEKVLYQVGNNAAVRRQFEQKLSEDRTGIAAAIFLGQLQTRVAAPIKKVSQAPKPSKPLPGGAPPVSTSNLHKKYLAATKAGNMQARIDLRAAARAQGVDVTTW